MTPAGGPATLFYLTLPPLMWASNAIVGRLSVAGSEPLISPIALNTLRWLVTLPSSRRRPRRRPARGPPRRGGGRDAGASWYRGGWRVYAIFGLLS